MKKEAELNTVMWKSNFSIILTLNRLISLPSVSGAVSFPTGKRERRSEEVGTALKLIATKTLRRTAQDSVHFNIAWRRNAAPREDERRHRYLAVLGYTRLLRPKTLLVTDYVREQEVEEEKTLQLIELGILQELTSNVVFL